MIIKAPIVYTIATPLVTCCHLMLNLRECYEKPLAITTTEEVELSEWSAHVCELPLNYGLDSMGLPRITSKRLVAPHFRPFIYPLQQSTVMSNITKYYISVVVCSYPLGGP